MTVRSLVVFAVTAMFCIPPVVATNVDESLVPAYALPEVLVLHDGHPVTTINQWQTQRRNEILALLKAQMYGQSPSIRPKVVAKDLMERTVFNGTALQQQVTLCLGSEPNAPQLDLLIYLPKQATTTPVPVFLGLNFQGNHTINADPGIRLCRSWLPEKNQATDTSRGVAASRWPVDMILNQGFGLVTLYYGDIDPDFNDGFKNGVHALYPELQTRNDNFTSIGAWAWGLSCVMDYLETDRHIDAKHVAVLGHSRLGKTSLWAGATDERFSLVISNDSGSGGAALFRRCFGERIKDLNTNFPHWFNKAFKQYSDKEDTLPFDQHMLISLMAPRPVYIASASEDTWADPKGEFLSAKAANPVYRLFGLEGLPEVTWPEPEHPVSGERMGYHLRTGKHDITAYDWTQYLAFAKQQWPQVSQSAERPNILWLTSEDNSPFLGCYGDIQAVTPNLDQLASQGILYTHAYANAPVCAPARCTIITGMYANSLGTHQMRSNKAIPQNIRFFTNLLREAGYYCTNNVKEDYNIAKMPEGCWDESSRTATYLNRKPGQPFFAVFNHTVSHESCLHRIEPVTHDPNKMKLAAYHPDNPEIRRDYAQYYDKITELDRQIGQKLKALKDAGLADNTIVFYYADHGGILTRSKRTLYDSGTRVPMIIHFPKKWQHLAPAKPGSKTDRLVSFVDLAPTILSLAGVTVPDHMQGHAFLGPQKTTNPQYTYMFRGRMDERIDMMRGITDGKYRYIHNYMPHLRYGEHLNYLWQMRTTQVWETLYQQGKCQGPQKAFWEPKPTEELYDSDTDPDNIHNLADDPHYQAIKQRLSNALRQWLLEICDPGFLPEGEMTTRGKSSTIFEMAHDPQQYNQAAILRVAELASQRDPDNLALFGVLLDDQDSAIRYWAAMGCLILGDKAAPLFDEIESLLEDPNPDVRIVAAEIIGKHRDPVKPLEILKAALNHDNEFVQLHAANTLDYLGDTAKPLLSLIKAKYKENSRFVSRIMTTKLETWGEIKPAQVFPKGL